MATTCQLLLLLLLQLLTRSGGAAAASSAAAAAAPPARTGNGNASSRSLVAAPAPAYELYAGVDDAAVNPHLAANDTAFVKSLGSTADAAACAAACGASAWTNRSGSGSAICQSFTFYNTSSAPAQLRGRCYGHVTTVWIPHVSASATSGRMLRPCASSTDCSLNGNCSASTGADKRPPPLPLF
jgi:hypothetical protein